jgi:predicted type IV restriction endonuclease
MLEKLVEQIKERLAAAQYQSESAIREAVVLPILQALEWDTLDPTTVYREYPLGTTKVDYALAAPPTKQQIFIEVKALGSSLGGDKQLFGYAYHEGIPFAILTDGREWNFYLPGEQGTYDERRVQKVDIVDRPITETIEVFRRYLTYAKVASGDALKSARADYENLSKRKTAVQNIPAAWRDLASEPDTLLMDLISEKVESLCGYRPGAEDVEEFLLKLTGGSQVQVAMPYPTPKFPPTPTASAPSTQIASERSVSYKIFDQSKHADNAIDALIDILRTLAGKNSSFLEKLAPTVRGRTRNHLAHAREDVYPQKPDLIEYTMQLVPGWWLGTNISNRDKMKIIERACEVEKLTFGKDISISLPNAKA